MENASWRRNHCEGILEVKPWRKHGWSRGGETWRRNLVERPAGFFFLRKMTSLDILDMLFINFNDFREYLVQISLNLFQINELCLWGF